MSKSIIVMLNNASTVEDFKEALNEIAYRKSVGTLNRDVADKLIVHIKEEIRLLEGRASNE
jgi:hypothetical protein